MRNNSCARSETGEVGQTGISCSTSNNIPFSSYPSPSSPQLPPPATRSRGRHGPKVRSGCITCKVRKVKCDEAKPSCGQCTATGRRCDGYVNHPSRNKTAVRVAAKTAPQHILTDIPDGTAQERWILYMYRQHLIKILHPRRPDGYAAVIVALANQDLIVREVTIALAIGFQRHTVGGQAIQAEPLLLTHYNRAISGLQQQLKRLKTHPIPSSSSEWIPILLAILQLVGSEIVRGNVTGASLHLDFLARIIVDNNLGHIKIGRKTGTICRICRVLQLNLRVYPGLEIFEPIHQSLPESPLPPWKFSLPFENNREAVVSWYDLLEEFLDLMRSSEPVYSIERNRQITDLSVRLDQWLEAVDAHPSSVNDGTEYMWDAAQRLVLRTNGRTLKLRLLVLQCGDDECNNDHFEPMMEDIIALARTLIRFRRRRQSTFWSHGTVLASVLHIALKCRNPRLRREAISWMENWTEWQGYWWGRATALAVARRVVSIEERAGLVTSSSDVSEAMRVRHVNIKIKPYNQKVHLAYFRWNDQGRLVLCEELISWLQ